MDAESFSEDPNVEFQFLLKGKPKRFRVADIDTQVRFMPQPPAQSNCSRAL